MDQWSTCPYEKAGLSTGDLGSPAMSPLLALVVVHVEPTGLEELEGCSRYNAGALLLPARDQLHTRCVLDGWLLSQNRPNYKSSSVETIDKQSSFQT